MPGQDNIITKILLIVLIGVAAYFIIKTSKNKESKAINNENNECFNENTNIHQTQQIQQPQNLEHFVEEIKPPTAEKISLDSLSLISNDKSDFSVIAHDASPEAVQAEVDYKPDIAKKLKNKNQAENGYKSAAYDKIKRGYEETTDWKIEFNNNQSNPRENSKFTPITDENTFHPYTAENQENKNTPEDLFDTSKLLPSETRTDWFEVMPDPINIKNRHLITTSRHIAVNTIGSSLRNPTYDLRPAPPNPKFVPGPWNQTTIEPDINGKSIF